VFTSGVNTTVSAPGVSMPVGATAALRSAPVALLPHAASCDATSTGGIRSNASTVAKVLDSPAMANIKVDCEVREIQHDWRRREARYSPHSTQSAGFYWKCERCDKETDTDAKPAT